MELGDVVDQLHDDDSLSHAGAAEGADLSSLEERTNQVNHFDAGGEHLRRRGLIHQRRGRPMNRDVSLRIHWSTLVDGTASDVEHAAHHAWPNRHVDRPAAIAYLVTALETFRA